MKLDDRVFFWHNLVLYATVSVLKRDFVTQIVIISDLEFEIREPHLSFSKSQIAVWF